MRSWPFCVSSFNRSSTSAAALLVGLLAVAAPLLMTSVAEAGTIGPDVTVFSLSGTTNYGAAGGIRGYSIGTTSCNIGDAPLNWCDNNGGCGSGTTSADHPVIAQNIYRLKDGRFQQIGASWLKHGFVSTNSDTPGCLTGTCTDPPLGGNQLGVGCTDPYGSSLNGSRPLGRKSEVDATTGEFPMPPGGGGSTSSVWNQRSAVAEADLEPEPTSTLYYIEGHYVAPDDAQSGNGLNNASYRLVEVEAGTFNLQMQGSTVREKSAIEVWPVVDPTVELINVDTPTVPVERFHVARKVTDLGGGVWHYEYAIHNMNSDRSADRFLVQFFNPVTLSNIGFADVNAHSNEPYDTTDWVATTAADSVTWEAPVFVPAQNSNAIRWATMYNFWFDANLPPSNIELHDLHLFKAGSPSSLVFLEGSSLLFADGFETGNTNNWDLIFP